MKFYTVNSIPLEDKDGNSTDTTESMSTEILAKKLKDKRSTRKTKSSKSFKSTQTSKSSTWIPILTLRTIKTSGVRKKKTIPPPCYPPSTTTRNNAKAKCSTKSSRRRGVRNAQVDKNLLTSRVKKNRLRTTSTPRRSPRIAKSKESTLVSIHNYGHRNGDTFHIKPCNNIQQ